MPRAEPLLEQRTLPDILICQTANNGFLKLSHENTHEAYRVETCHIVHHLVGVVDGDTELIPSGNRTITVGQAVGVGIVYVVDVVFTHYHFLMREVDDILIVTFIFAQGIIVVHVLHVREVGGGGWIVFNAVVLIRRVAFRIVEVFVTFHYF